MSTVTYTPSASGSILQTKTFTNPPAPPTQPISCANVVTAAKLASSAAALKTEYFFYIQAGNANTFLTFKNDLDTADTDATTALTATVSATLQDYLTNLENKVIPIQEYVTNCVKDDVRFNAADYDAQVKATDESKSRLDAITTPEQHVSYYDGWFPLFRPMKESALFGLFAVSIFMLLLSVLIFLKMKGIEINIIMPQGSIDLSWMTKYLSYSVIGIGIGFAVAYILYKYYPSAIGM
jgi:hypothetical protein